MDNEEYIGTEEQKKELEEWDKLLFDCQEDHPNEESMEDQLTTKPDAEKQTEMMMALEVCGAEDEKEKNALDDWFPDDLLEESEKEEIEDIKEFTAEEAYNLLHKDLDELYETETEYTTGNGQKYKKKTIIPPVNTECQGNEAPTEEHIAKVMANPPKWSIRVFKRFTDGEKVVICNGKTVGISEPQLQNQLFNNPKPSDKLIRQSSRLNQGFAELTVPQSSGIPMLGSARHQRQKQKQPSLRVQVLHKLVNSLHHHPNQGMWVG